MSTPRVSQPGDAEKALAEDEIVSATKQVRFNVSEYTIEVLAKKLRDNEIYVPEYQRNLTWKQAQKSKFIESVLVGLPIPFLFFWQADDGRLEIVDGSQRLRTIREFIDDELRLSELELLPRLNGFRYSDLDRSRQRRFENRSIRGIILDNDTTPVTRSEMFSRINTGGTNANEAEIRRGVLPGPLTDLIVKLAESPRFVRLTPLPKGRIDLREREELVARYFAYSQRAKIVGDEVTLPDYKDQPKLYIYEYIETANKQALSGELATSSLEQEFARTMEFIERIFPNGFLKNAGATQVPRARFEAISVGTAFAISEQPGIFAQKVEVLSWLTSPEFESVTTSGGSNVKSKLAGRINFVRRKLLVGSHETS